MDTPAVGHLGAQDWPVSSELANTENAASPSAPEMRPLTLLQRRCIAYYLGQASGNQSLAYLMAKCHPDPLPDDWSANASVRATAAGIFAMPNVRAELARRLSDDVMDKPRLLARIADAARGIPAECWSQAADGSLLLDWDKVRSLGLGHLVIGVDAQGRPKLADPQAAWALLSRYYGMTGPDVAIAIRVDPSRLSDDELAVAIRTGQLPGT
jgi:hypothetical protein